MTTKLFWEEPCLATLETTVASVVGSMITLRETIFYAFSGGQESDSGIIGGYPVLDAVKSNLQIQYPLPGGHGLIPGDKVRVEIDWERRYRLMRLHFAAEVVLELAYRTLPAMGKIGAHISEDKVRLDFSWPKSLAPLLPELTSKAQQLINQDAKIISAFSDEEQQLCYWEIAGFANPLWWHPSETHGRGRPGRSQAQEPGQR